MIKSTMPKVCAVTATINMEELKNHGIAITTNYMLLECAKYAT